MNYEQIEQVAALFEAAPTLTEIEVRNEGVALRLRRPAPGSPSFAKNAASARPSLTAPLSPFDGTTAATPALSSAASANAAAAAEAAELVSSGAVAGAGNTLVTAYMVGIFRASAARDGKKQANAAPIEVGETVIEGQALGSVETMRILNECSAPLSGVIQSVFVSDGQPVEYGQALFEIAPASAASDPAARES